MGSFYITQMIEIVSFFIHDDSVVNRLLWIIVKFMLIIFKVKIY